MIWITEATTSPLAQVFIVEMVTYDQAGRQVSAAITGLLMERQCDKFLRNRMNHLCCCCYCCHCWSFFFLSTGAVISWSDFCSVTQLSSCPFIESYRLVELIDFKKYSNIREDLRSHLAELCLFIDEENEARGKYVTC